MAVSPDRVLLLLLSLPCSMAGGSGGSAQVQVPTRRFGRTELQMPVLTMGGMRMQQTWKPKEGMTMADVDPDCQANFMAILEKALAHGVTHFETAYGYGCSELQYGAALRELLKRHPRESLIIQSKVAPAADPKEFRATLDKTLATLDVGYLDLFTFHGINDERQLLWTLPRAGMLLNPGEGGCMEVAKEYQAAGKIRHIGFSTHGMTPLIVQAIETGMFDYVNLHFHFIGSYTASGSGAMGGNQVALAACAKQDMGVFIISPNDKGGMLYKPPEKLANATAPLSPMAFNNLFLLSFPEVHTMVVGAARPSDWEEHLSSIARLPESAELVPPIAARLNALMDTALQGSALRHASGPDAWWRGVPDLFGNVDGEGALVTEENNPDATNYLLSLWCWRLVKGWDLLEYCRQRNDPLAANRQNWNSSAPYETNLLSMNNWAPGLSASPLSGGLWEGALKRLGAERRLASIIALHETYAWLKQGSQRALPPFASDQPDTPWPERADTTYTPSSSSPTKSELLLQLTTQIIAQCHQLLSAPQGGVIGSADGGEPLCTEANARMALVVGLLLFVVGFNALFYFGGSGGGGAPSSGSQAAVTAAGSQQSGSAAGRGRSASPHKSPSQAAKAAASRGRSPSPSPKKQK